MNEKLKVLLEKINLEEKNYSFFMGGKLEKLLVDKNKKTWHFFITLKEVLDVEVVNELKEKIRTTFSDLKEVFLTINYVNNNYDKIGDYLNLILKEIKLDKIYGNREYILDEGVLQLSVLNKIEEKKLNGVKDKIEKIFFDYGFKIEFNPYINDKEKDLLKEEIKNETNIKSKSKVKIENSILIGNEIKTKRIMPVNDLLINEDNVVVSGYLFAVDFREITGKDFKIILLKLNDSNDSVNAKYFTRNIVEYEKLQEKLKVGTWVKIRGNVREDKYLRDFVINISDLEIIPNPKSKKEDKAPIKRVELHTHTHMSQMDSVVNVLDLINRAKDYGHKSIAITDHNCCQAFPEAYLKSKDIKIIYGVELNVIEDDIDIVIRETDEYLKDMIYVVFDFETTGFNATSGDSIIEVGAVKLLNGEIIDRFQELIDPGKKLATAITEVTGITNQDLKGKRSESEVIADFKEWIGNLPLVAHNAKFDVSFLESAYNKCGFLPLDNTVIDTLELSRALEPNVYRHSLSALVKRYEIPFDEESHHRADYDAEATALIFDKMIKKLDSLNYEKISDIEKLVSKDEIHKFGRTFHINLLAKNQIGLKNLFNLVSLANTKYFYKTPRILKSEIEKNREGLLIGSGCSNGEVFVLSKSKSDEELNNVISFYDYIEVQPLRQYEYLLQTKDFASSEDLKNHLLKIIELADKNKKPIVATGDVHQLDPEDKIYREIIVNQKVPGGGRHPLARNDIKSIPSQHFLTTDEMLEEFYFLDKEKALEIVVDNTVKIAEEIENVIVIKNSKKPLSPKMENSDKIVRDLTYEKAHLIYGDPLPKIIEERIDKELQGIINGGFDVIYLIAQMLVKKSNDDGYLVGSRGSVGSSLVAHFMGITEVNPLSAHYVCPKCKTSLFEEDGVLLGSKYASGFDLPNKRCSCGTLFKKEGQDMPFATFLGFDADKVPDIDLNFSGDYQSQAHDYVREVFGKDYVFRAGTIGTVASKTALGFVKGYMEEHGLNFKFVEQERLALGCTGVKRTTGQHPGGIIVVPNYMDVLDFTPYQYPADDVNSNWYTTHFDYHPMENDLLKLDILGHDDPTVLKKLQDLSGIDILTIPFDDPETLSLFSTTKALGVTPEEIMSEVGTYGVPEFGTRFVMDLLLETRPSTFAELVKISGLSHGTDVWRGNAQELIKNKICSFSDVIGCRDDIMVYLSYHGMAPKEAFKLMEFVRKGKPSQDKVKWQEEFVPKMKAANIPEWYIDSCSKIKYMFPKAHAVAYVMMACRVAWFKVHEPLCYYAAYLSVRCHDFDIETMMKGYTVVKAKIVELNNKGYEKTNKEEAILDVLYSTLELYARGFTIGEIDLLKSDSNQFIIKDDKTLIPPFSTLDGLGGICAQKIIEERKKASFLSVEDLQRRCKVSSTLIDKMKRMGILNGLPDTNQLTLF